MPDILDPSIDQMRPRLLTLDKLRDRLSTTEPVVDLSFEAQQGVEFSIGSNWDAEAVAAEGSDPVDARVRLHPGADERRLTKDALLELGAKVGIPRKLQERTPAHLLQPWLNWWFAGNGGWEGKKFKAFATGELVSAVGSGTIVPFSNLGILDQLVAGLQGYYKVPDAEILVDYKLVHGLELTHARLIVPGESRSISGPGTASPSDLWSTGVQWRNSQLGLRPTSVDGYLFRWTCTNGMCDTLVTSGQFNRRAGGLEEDDVYSWARASVDNVLGGLEHTLDGVQATTVIPVEQDVTLVLDDLFRQHSVPAKLRAQIVRNMAETGGDLSMYSILNSVTQAANDPDLSPAAVDKLMRTGGHVAHSAEQRCGECRRIKPE